MSSPSHDTDIELGCRPIIVLSPSVSVTWPTLWLQRLGAIIRAVFHGSPRDGDIRRFRGYQSIYYARFAILASPVMQMLTAALYLVEDQPKGYPQFSSLMAAHESFQVFRRFTALRTRLLLLAQDRITQLESRLGEIDQAETRPIFLASNRKDRNEERKHVILELHDALKDYDEALDRSFRISNFEVAQFEHTTSLLSWNASNACISREETEFLSYPQDLLCLSAPGDTLLSWLERRISENLLRISKRGRSMISKNPHVHIYSQPYVSTLTRALVIPLLIVLVLIPIVICNSYDSLNARLIVIVMATSTFLTVLALFTKGKVLELAVAGATQVLSPL